MPYLMWFDDRKKRAVTDKIADGAAAYQKHFGHACNVVFVSEADKDVAAPQGITVKPAGYVRPDNFWFGYEPFVS